MRKPVKTIKYENIEYIPKAYRDNPDLSKEAADIKDRPLIVEVRKITTEDRINLSALAEMDEYFSDEGEKKTKMENTGTILKYLWCNCVQSVKNVMYTDRNEEVVRGHAKDLLFNSPEMMDDVLDTIAHIQEISSFTDKELKN